MSIYSHKDTLQRLKKYNNSPAPIVSVYFQLPKSPVRDGMAFSSCSDVINHELSPDEKKIAQKNLEYILGFLQEYKRKDNEQSLAIFSGGDSFFEIIHLPYRVKNAAYFSHSPILQPLLKEESVYRRFLIILIDREKARFFTTTQGIVEKSGEIYDPSVPQNVHADSQEAVNLTREDKINRHILVHLHRHFEKIANGIVDFTKGDAITGVIIGGHKNLFQQFEKNLPKQLQEKVVGEFITEVNIDINILIVKSKKLIEEINNQLNNQQSPFIARH